MGRRYVGHLLELDYIEEKQVALRLNTFLRFLTFPLLSMELAFLLAGSDLGARENDGVGPTKDDNSSAASTAAKREPDKHIFGVLPNYRTAADNEAFHRLTWRQKFNIARHDSFDPPGYVIAACYAAVYHLENTNPDFGQGLQG